MLQQKNILHYPQLDTVLMVEEFIRENGGEYKKKSLWQSLPKKMMYQTYCVIFDYLQSSGKIAVDREGHVCWIFDPEGVRKYLEREDLTWSSHQQSNSPMKTLKKSSSRSMGRKMSGSGRHLKRHSKN